MIIALKDRLCEFMQHTSISQRDIGITVQNYYEYYPRNRLISQ